MPNENVNIGTPAGDLARWFGEPGRLAVQRAVAELRSCRPVKLVHASADPAAGAFAVAAAEMLGGARIKAWHAAGMGALRLILPGPRLAHLGIHAGGIDAAGASAVALDDLSAPEIDALIMAVEPALPRLVHRPAEAVEIAALELMKRAYLLPAAVMLPLTGDDGAMVEVNAAAIADFHDQSARDLSIAARTRVPLAEAVDSEFVVFRGGDGLREQLAIIVGKPDPAAPVLTRLHSACLTGDLFASLKCDCGDQLRGAVREIAAAGGGVLLYLDQEGRGIGLVNKMRAYGLQALGHDTVDADAVLGYGPDERRYAVAGAMLALLGYRRIELMTNNPGKIEALADFGVNVMGHRRLIGTVNPHNHDYLQTKARRAGHYLNEIPEL